MCPNILQDPNRPSWEQYKKDNEDKLDMVGADMRKMAEYRAQLDREREMKLAQGSGNSYKRSLHSDSEDDEGSDDSSGHHHKKKKYKKEKKSKKDKKKHHKVRRRPVLVKFLLDFRSEISKEKEKEWGAWQQ